MPINKKFFVLLIALLIFAVNVSAVPTMKIKINETEFSAEIAQTKDARKKGLMNRKKLDDNSAMIFIFSEPQILSFWMKNTQIPLSIAFIDSAGIITQIEKMKPYSLKHVNSKKKCCFALEVNMGFFKTNNIKPGDEVHFK